MLGLCLNLVAYLRVRSTQSGLGSCFHDQNCFDFRHLSSTTYTCVCLLRRDAPMMAAYLKICCRVPSAVPWRAGTRTAFRTWAGCCSFRWSIKPERQRYITTALYCYSIVTLPTRTYLPTYWPTFEGESRIHLANLYDAWMMIQSYWKLIDQFTELAKIKNVLLFMNQQIQAALSNSCAVSDRGRLVASGGNYRTCYVTFSRI